MKLGIVLVVIGFTGAFLNLYAYAVGHIHLYGTEWLVVAPCLFFGIRRISKQSRKKKEAHNG